MEDADADTDANAGDARDFEDANADADRLGEDANAEANMLIGLRVRILYVLFSLMVIEAPPKSIISSNKALGNSLLRMKIFTSLMQLARIFNILILVHMLKKCFRDCFPLISFIYGDARMN